MGGIIGKAAASGAITTGQAVVAASTVGGAASGAGKGIEGAVAGKAASTGEIAVAAIAGASGGGLSTKIGLSALSKVESMAASGGIAGHLGITTQTAIQKGGSAIETSVTTGQKAAQIATDTASSYVEKRSISN